MDSKDLYTYVSNICYREPVYSGLVIIVTDSAMRELFRYRKTLNDVIKILEEGYVAPRKRKPDTIEKWLDKGNKTFNVVISKDFNEIRNEECWVLIHFGKFSKGKQK